MHFLEVPYVINKKGAEVPGIVTISRRDVIALIEEAAKSWCAGNKTEAAALAVWRLLDRDAWAFSLFEAHRGSVRVREG